MPAIGNKKSHVDVDLVIRTAAVLPVEYYTFMSPGDGFVYCSGYAANGAYVGERCAPLTEIPRASASPSLDSGFVYIPTDSGGFVGDGSAAVLDADAGSIIVYNPIGVASASASVVGSGWDVAAGSRGVGFNNGWLYWPEIKVSGTPFVFDVRLRKCRCDGSGVATVATMNATFYDRIDGMMMQSDAALIFLGYTADSTMRAIVRISLAGSSSGPDTFTGNKDPGNPGLPIASGKSIAVFPGPHFSGPLFGYRLGSCTNASATTFAGLWPDVGWGSGFQMSVNAAGTEASLYDGATLVRNSVSTIGGSPTVSVAVQSHPLGAFFWPNLFFIAT